jgi:hypothetical protein
MSEVGITMGAQNLDACHAVAAVGFGLDVCAFSGAKETGPATAGVVFIVGMK